MASTTTKPALNTSVPTPSNPSTLPPRFAIRRLEPKHSPWAAAIVMHSNLYHSPVWPIVYPTAITARLHKGMKSAAYLVDHQINSGMSFGVFDTEYAFKRPESAQQGGKLWWDETEPSVQEAAGPEAESARLLAQMDFPLVSVALSYDAIDPLDMARMAALIDTLPLFGELYHHLEILDPRAPADWKPDAARQVLMRNATSTRRDYEEHHLMSGTARWLMREAAAEGYRGVQIEALHDKVAWVWSHPEEPFRGSVVSQVDMATFVDEEGKKVFEPATQTGSKIFVHLKPAGGENGGT
ncbi:hypothetical protein K505DRAFT_327367 [Melanomma pulvis-pyrius CBS 109.77]|uniref:Uncharacterized protein n=1 Tax=Melanomma pulvis-pyrius CBS 109.77 TaxID=1314802 RepID=A0A6A6X3E8_9PLEO|nr:hypothetical protein K505DRAFT_327367 [Melanomma pulvis-pyrius CBS 109.77]